MTWIRWQDSPPCIPDAPIEITLWPEIETPMSTVTVSTMLPEWHESYSLSLYWRPTGHYRQEFWEVTGVWE